MDCERRDTTMATLHGVLHTYGSALELAKKDGRFCTALLTHVRGRGETPERHCMYALSGHVFVVLNWDFVRLLFSDLLSEI